MLADLAGRWLAGTDGDDGGLVLIDTDGGLTFIGGEGDEGVRLKEASGEVEHHFVLVQEKDDQELCTVELEQNPGADILRLRDPDGYVETWHRTSNEDGQPKVVLRRRSSAGMQRSWTKEGQAGSPKNVEGCDGEDDKHNIEVLQEEC
mmetsp:Transcript_81068/g.224301  ORF Transcript_81068/g.224301 Transcript_81068/m.224301 type:complete len:148 (-) Transcript_81068:167-610(-)|eukprot:CAMPEP_0179087394 /NCGR_PEP_ID=MMETSP0796-20121207/39704_1 /TAXON_ID=73915 /ORGANISM="Pyrodinium bahamense, Strain pbaha01" /LENGTH=147 /DNA_ID=CAMNT_0020784897 /DNA_START=83 /DNA_END=526 /DNA_ORIENTATION=+